MADTKTTSSTATLPPMPLTEFQFEVVDQPLQQALGIAFLLSESTSAMDRHNRAAAAALVTILQTVEAKLQGLCWREEA